MYAGQPAQRRRKKRHTHGLKTVEVARGRNGYGFTISGQHPCILSCIVSGSPADRMGLKTGDFLLSVNNNDVSRASHDDVVRMIGSSRGILILQITENVNSSESSDDELPSRPKSKYPNRTRVRQTKPPAEEPVMYNREKRHAGRSRREQSEPAKLRALSPGREIDRRRAEKYDRFHHDMRSMGIENIDPSSGAPIMPPPPKPQKNVTTNDGIIRYRSPNTKHTIVTREARLGRNQNGLDHGTRGHPAGSNLVDPSSHGGPRKRESRDPQRRHHAQPEVYDDIEADNMLLGDYLRVIVGYVGTIGMARDSKNDTARMQSIRNAVHRLKVERKLTTMVLMELAGNGVRLINNMGSTVALYTAEHIAFSGISSEDKRFFGIVTIHIETMDDSRMDEDVSDSSCHVFKVNPELCSHSLHVHKARNFGIHCTMSPNTQQCMEFPRSALPIMKYMSHLYRDRPSALYETEMAHIGAFARPEFAPQRQEPPGDNSSHKAQGQRPPNRVYVVDMHNNTPQSDGSARWDGQSNSYKFGDPNISAIYPEDRASGSGTSDFSIPPNPANTSESSQDNSIQLNTMERLNVRAMPDPRASRGERPTSTDSGVGSRGDTQRIMLTRQHHTASVGGEDMDTESINSNDSQGSTTPGCTSDIGQINEKTPSIRTGSDPRFHQPNPQNLNTTATSLCSTRNDSYTDSSYYVTSGRHGPNVSAISSRSAISSTDSSMGSFDTTTTPTPTPNAHIQGRSLPRPPSYPTKPVPQPPTKLPTLPKAKRPPVPERQPIIPRKNPKTPLRPPPGKKKAERPKSTPPFKRNIVGVDQDGYDSDPGSSLLDPPEQWSYEVPKHTKASSVMPGRGDPRRFSEGYVLSKQKEKNKTENTKKSGSFRQNTDKPFRRPTLSNSHESLVVTEHDPTNNHLGHSRLHAAASVTTITNKGLVLTRHTDGSVDSAGTAASWAVSFDKLLSDPQGLQIFTDFLRKEYSEENIVFWEKCEKFRKLSGIEERKKAAAELYNDHVAENASEPVNVDSAARLAASNGLSEAPPTTFESAQSQIFRLMKQDSYARFLKSDGYKACVVAEMEGKPLPIAVGDRAKDGQVPSAPPTPIDRWKKQTMKKSKSSSAAEEPGEEKRRRSLLPWNKKDKGEKKITKTTTDADLHRAPLASTESLDSKTRPSLDLADLSAMSKQITGSLEEVDPNDVAPRESHKFCRVILPDNSTTVIPARPGQMIRKAVVSLCDRRYISLAVINVYLAGSTEVLDMTRDLSTLGSKQIRLEKQVVFRMDLPQRKYLCVRAKPSQTVATVFNPILQRHNLQISNNLVMHVAGTGVILKDDQDISTLDQKQVIVQSLDDFKGKKRKEWGSHGNHNRMSMSTKPPIPKVRGDASKQKKPFDDIVGSLFRDILDSLATSLDMDSVTFDENGVWDVSKYKSEETRGSGILGFIRRNSIGEKEGSKMKAKTKTLTSVRTSGSKLPPPNAAPPLPPNPRIVRGKRFDADDERLFELLSRAQSRQMDDQRGMSARDLELPEFLRVGGDGQNQEHSSGSLSARVLGDGTQSSTSVSRPRSAPTARAQSVDCLVESSMSKHFRQSSDAQHQINQGLMTPRTAKLAAGNESFGHEGVVPTPNRATNYFTEDLQRPLSPNFDDSRIMERSIGDLGLCSDLQGQGVSFNTYMSKSGSSMTNLRSGLPTHTASNAGPSVPHRQNPPGIASEKRRNTSSDPERLRCGSVTASSDEELDITLIPPSDTSSDAEPLWPSPPRYLNASSLEHTERANFLPPTPLMTDCHLNGVVNDAHRSSGRALVRTVSAGSDLSANYRPRDGLWPGSDQRSVHVKAGSADLSLDLCSVASSERSGPSTPSPTTHDLVFEGDSGSDVGMNPPQLTRPQTTQPSSQPQTVHPSQPQMQQPYRSIDSRKLPEMTQNRARKSLAFDKAEVQPETGIQVSFV